MATIRGVNTLDDLKRLCPGLGLDPMLAREALASARLDGDTIVCEAPKARGRRTDGRAGMNKTEAQYAATLEARKLAGEIVGYWYEPLKFRLADRTYYSPDFMVMLPDGLLEIHEVKGWLEDDAAVKLKVCAAQFSMFTFRLVKKQGKTWTEKVVPA